MDCSRTEVFLNELKRMCGEAPGCCPECPARFTTVCSAVDMLPALQKAVQKWSDEHPEETVLEHFKKILPNMTVEVKNDMQEASICPYILDGRISRGYCESDVYPCADCWNRPYEEAIRESEKC